MHRAAVWPLLSGSWVGLSLCQSSVNFMSSFSSVCDRRLFQRGAGAVICLILMTCGCRQADRIETYAVPKDAPRIVAAADNSSPAESSASADRMLAAILPDGGKAWF